MIDTRLFVASIIVPYKRVHWLIMQLVFPIQLCRDLRETSFPLNPLFLYFLSQKVKDERPPQILFRQIQNLRNQFPAETLIQRLRQTQLLFDEILKTAAESQKA